MARSARSTAWHGVDLCYSSVARQIVARLTPAEWRGLLLYPAALTFSAGVLASCMSGQGPAQPQSSAARLPPPSRSEIATHAQAAPRPGRKPPAPNETYLSGTNGPGTSGGAVAAVAPQPVVGAPASEGAPSAGDRASVSGPPSPAASASPETRDLIGLDQPAATRMFGQATERSEEPPATVWRYKNGVCELDLFFYLDLRSGRMRTLHYAVRGSDADTSRRQECLRSLIASRAG